MLHFIEPAPSAPHAANAVVALKKGPDGQYTANRVCYNYKAINLLTKDMHTRYPVAEELFQDQETHSGSHGSTYDLAFTKSTLQRHPRIFQPSGGTSSYTVKRVPFGLKQAPAYFQKVLETELGKRGLLKFCKAPSPDGRADAVLRLRICTDLVPSMVTVLSPAFQPQDRKTTQGPHRPGADLYAAFPAVPTSPTTLDSDLGVTVDAVLQVREVLSICTKPLPSAVAKMVQSGVTLYEMCGGCVRLEATLRNGIRVNRYLYSDTATAAQTVARFRTQALLKLYPHLLQPYACDGAFTTCARPICVDAATFNSGAHRLRNKWQNLVDPFELQRESTQSGGLQKFCQRLLRPWAQHHACLQIRRSSFCLANKIGQPRTACHISCLSLVQSIPPRQTGSIHHYRVEHGPSPAQTSASACLATTRATAAPGLTAYNGTFDGQLMDQRALVAIIRTSWSCSPSPSDSSAGIPATIRPQLLPASTPVLFLTLCPASPTAVPLPQMTCLLTAVNYGTELACMLAVTRNASAPRRIQPVSHPLSASSDSPDSNPCTRQAVGRRHRLADMAKESEPLDIHDDQFVLEYLRRKVLGTNWPYIKTDRVNVIPTHAIEYFSAVLLVVPIPAKEAAQTYTWDIDIAKVVRPTTSCTAALRRPQHREILRIKAIKDTEVVVLQGRCGCTVTNHARNLSPATCPTWMAPSGQIWQCTT
eukprot:gene29093-biopygen32957